jgi:hypothetical protein
MTVTTTANSIRYAGNGTTTAFAFPYIFFAPTDLVVTLVVTATNAPVTPPPVLGGGATYDYTVSGDITDGEYASGGTVTFRTAPITGYSVLLVRSVPATQGVTLIDNTKFPAATVNVEFDRLTVLAQQASSAIGVSLQIPSYEAGLIVTAAPASVRANKLLLWDASGNLSTIDTANIIGGSVPGGPAAGDLSGSYPNPAIKTNVNLAGSPTTTTPATADNTTKIATTAHVKAAITAAAVGPVMRFDNEVVLASPANSMTVTVPPTAKAIEIWFATSNVGGANDTVGLMLNDVQSGTPNVGLNHNGQNTFSVSTTVGGLATGGTNGWALGGTTMVNEGVLRVQLGFPHFVDINADYFTLNAANALTKQQAAMYGGITGTTGFRLMNGSGTNMIVGSYMRVFAVY